MPQMLGVANAFWIAGFVIEKLDGKISWGWGLTLAVAFAPLIMIALGCWWAVIAK